MRHRAQAGVTLPEVLVAMLLVGIALVPLVRLYPGIIDADHASEVTTVLSAVAVRKVEENISILRAPSSGGITLDNSVTRGSSGSQTSTSATLTIGASATYLVVLVGLRDEDSTVSSVSVGGSAAGRLVAHLRRRPGRARSHSSSSRRAELWGLVSPPPGP